MSRAFIADTTALILFFAATGILNERFVAGMAWEQGLYARHLGATLMVPVGRPYDAAVAAACGWPEDISTKDAPVRLLDLNRERAAAQGKA